MNIYYNRVVLNKNTLKLLFIICFPCVDKTKINLSTIASLYFKPEKKWSLKDHM